MPQVFPNSDVLTTGWTAVPGPMFHTALADGSDGTYVASAISGALPLTQGLASPILPGLNMPVPIRIHVTSGDFTARLNLLDDVGNVLGSSAWFTVTVTSPTTVTPTVTITTTATRVQLEPGAGTVAGLVTEDGTFIVTEDGTYIVWE